MKALLLKYSGGLIVAGLLLLALWADPAGRYLNLPGLLLVVAGTLAAAAVAHTFRAVADLLRRIPDALKPTAPLDPDELHTFLRIAEWHRLGQIRSAEQAARRLQAPVLRGGVELVLGRTPESELNRMLHWKIGSRRERDQDDIRLLRTMAAFAPAFGMLGTLFGLIRMMYALDASHLEGIGTAMGFALLTTVYGLVVANLMLKPVAVRLERRARDTLAGLYLQAELVRLLYERAHPALIEDYWRTYAGHADSGDMPAMPPLAAVKPSA